MALANGNGGVASVAEVGAGDESPARADAEAERLATTRLVARAVRRAQDGDRDALGFLYARYADNVLGYVKSIVHDQAEAEDVTQHVFAKLIRVIGKYEEREVPFLAWVLRVARNVAIDHVRGQRLVPVEEVRIDDSVGRGSWGGGLAELQDALAQLPEDQREVLVLRHLGGFSPIEIARHMERSEGSVHGLHHRGRRALKAELSRRGLAPATIAPDVLDSPGGDGLRAD